MSYEEVKKSNELFEKFYNELNIVPEGEERKEFWTAMRRELPNSFRFTGSKGWDLWCVGLGINTDSYTDMRLPSNNASSTTISLRLST